MHVELFASRKIFLKIQYLYSSFRAEHLVLYHRLSNKTNNIGLTPTVSTNALLNFAWPRKCRLAWLSSLYWKLKSFFLWYLLSASLPLWLVLCCAGRVFLLLFLNTLFSRPTRPSTLSVSIIYQAYLILVYRLLSVVQSITKNVLNLEISAFLL